MVVALCCMLVVTALLGCLRVCIVLVLVRVVVVLGGAPGWSVVIPVLRGSMFTPFLSRACCTGMNSRRRL